MRPAKPSSASGNAALGNARAAKQDEFYTQLNDVANELRHYRDHLRGKVVLCNCDDPFESNFFRYFALNFNALGLRKLVATSYQGSPIVGDVLPFEEFASLRPQTSDLRPQTSDLRPQTSDLRPQTSDLRPQTSDLRQLSYVVEINKVPDFNGDGAIDLFDVEHLLRHDANASRPLTGDGTYGAGDFRSRECVDILRAADVVVTNPPFSLFREYVAQLVAHDKRFLVVGARNAIHYQEIFRLIQANRIWLGTGFAGGNAYFKIPPENARNFAPGVYDENTGLVKFRNVGWFTNLDHAKRHESIPLYRRYSPEEYPTYDNLEAIEVSRVMDIPIDWDGMMGVPDTFLDRFNPDQFELVGIPFGDLGKSIGVTRNHRGRTDIAITEEGKVRCPYSRIIVRRKSEADP